MSAGVFINTFYPATFEAGAIYPIRVQPETIAAVVSPPTGADIPNTPDAGPANRSVSAEVGGSVRRSGVHAAVVYLALTGTAPTGYAENSRTTIPALNPTFFANARRRATVTYLGTTWRVVGRRAEVIR